MTTAHNIVEAVEVFDLGEDGEAWLALGCDSESVARIAVIRVLRAQLGVADPAFAESVDLLLDLDPQYRSGWYFHDDGVHDPILRAALYSTADVQVLPGIAFGIPQVQQSMRPLAPGQAAQVHNEQER